ncbi:MAG: biotin/lipoyl-binding protein [Terracidiphilus sp.]
MNLSEALDAALPEIPKERLSRSRPPQLDPELIIRDGVLDGEPFVGVLQRGKNNYFRLSPSQWMLAQLFDGERTYVEIAEAFAAETGVAIEVAEVRSFADQMDELDFWFKTHQEKNLAMREKLLAQRGRRTKSKINVAHISFSAWDPDRYLGWVDRRIGRFIYSGWCALAVAILLIFETVVVVENWRVISPDTVLFFNFAQKNWGDFAEFWLLIMVVGFCHETAHGLTCKHFGGEVHSMGLMFLYFVPCFFVDVTESWVSATKIQRLGTIMAGIWVELVMCGIAMIFWLNAPPGSSVHRLAYEVILLTGIAAVVINLNPLIKLDGYYFATEIIEIPDLKERSTAFLTGWFQAKVLRLPVEVPVVPRRRALLFGLYAFVSGLYSYVLLFFVVRLSYRLGSRFMADFALIPSAAFAFALYRSRLRSLGRVLKEVRERNSESGFRWRPAYVVAGLGLIVLLFVPLWRDREDAFFVIEPAESHAVCASVPGRVNAVLVQEGQQVRSGQPLLQMTSSQAASMRSAALAQTGSARFKTFDAQVQGQSVGTAAADQTAAQKMTTLAKEAQSGLELTAPADGTVLTDDPALLVNEDVGYGQPLLELAEGERMVRMYIPTSALDRISASSEVAFALPGQFSMIRLKLPAPAGDPVALPAGLASAEKYQGFKSPVFYSSRIALPAAAGSPRYGLAGTAKIFGEKRSLAGRAAATISNLVRAHLW